MKPLLLGSVLLTCSDGKQQRQKKKPELPASEKENKHSTRKTQAQGKGQSGSRWELKLSMVLNPNLEPAA